MTQQHDLFEDPQAVTSALETILIQKDLASSDAIDRVIDLFENEVSAVFGARAVARAWADRDFKARLLQDARGALETLGIGGLKTEHLVVVENTPQVHNVICCTLCSCYPWSVLGLPPSWYKSLSYRSRIVLEPREVLAEFGLLLPPDVEIRVWDSNSDIRYMVLPEPPSGFHALAEEQLASLVTRDALIGVAKVENGLGA